MNRSVCLLSVLLLPSLITIPLMTVTTSFAAGQDPEPAVILTPKPGPHPRINGAKVFGVRPGSPFLYSIPATGDRPMSYQVEKLPGGLSLDAISGQITGIVR